MKTKTSIIMAAGLVLMGLVLGLCLRSGINAFVNKDRTVVVRGLCERECMANKVTWPLVYKLGGNDLQTIYSQIESDNLKVVNFLTSNGLSENEYSINAPDIIDKQADAYNNQPMPYRYIVKSVITVTSDKVDLVNSLIKKQGELLKSGVAIVADEWNYQTIYEYTGLNEIKPSMIADATKNARDAAEKFAEDSGSKIGRIIQASQGQFSIEDRDPYTPYIKKVRVVTSLTYSIED